MKLSARFPYRPEKASLRAVESAYKAYDSWRKLPISSRLSYLFKLRKAMEEHVEELAVTIAVDQAKHISEARGEVSGLSR